MSILRIIIACLSIIFVISATLLILSYFEIFDFISTPPNISREELLPYAFGHAMGLFIYSLSSLASGLLDLVFIVLYYILNRRKKV